MVRYYLDTCIWLDYYEDRKDRFRPLGEWALRFIKKAVSEEDIVIISNMVREELRPKFTDEDIKRITGIVPRALLMDVRATKEQAAEARRTAMMHEVPFADALHTIIARDHGATIITRDAHFHSLYPHVKKPEELL